MKLIHLLTIFLMVIANSLFAQQFFKTAAGEIQITAVLNDSVVTAQSKELIVMIDYEKGEFFMRLNRSSLHTEDETLDSLMHEGDQYEEITYTGKFDQEFISTGDHPPQDLEVSGWISTDPEHNEVVGQGHIQHIYNGFYSCAVTFKLILYLDQIGIFPKMDGLENKIEVEILQSVLNEENH